MRRVSYRRSVQLTPVAGLICRLLSPFSSVQNGKQNNRGWPLIPRTTKPSVSGGGDLQNAWIHQGTEVLIIESMNWRGMCVHSLIQPVLGSVMMGKDIVLRYDGPTNNLILLAMGLICIPFLLRNEHIAPVHEGGHVWQRRCRRESRATLTLVCRWPRKVADSDVGIHRSIRPCRGSCAFTYFHRAA